MTNKNKTRTGIGVERKENESAGSLSRRFLQKVRRSGVLLEARQRKYRQPKKNKTARRRSALVRVERGEKYKKLRKWGKLK